MKSSMQQVPNPLPKVLSRRAGGANSLEVERENFERSQVIHRESERERDVCFFPPNMSLICFLIEKAFMVSMRTRAGSPGQEVH